MFSSPLIRIVTVLLAGYALLALFFQFIFSFLNQRRYGLRLSALGFGIPFMIILEIVCFFILLVIANPPKTVFAGIRNPFMLLCLVVLGALLVWQGWYLVVFINQKSNYGVARAFRESIPIAISVFITLYFMFKLSRGERR